MEEGTHDELIQKEGTYKKLVARQLNAGEMNDGLFLEGSNANTPNLTPKLPRKDANEEDGSEMQEKEVHV